MNIHVAGENALIVYLGETVSEHVTAAIHHLCLQLKPYLGRELIDLIPSYASVLVVFDPLKTDHLQVRKWIRYASERHFHKVENDLTNLVRLPVFYAGIDLAEIAQQADLSIQDVIDRHANKHYQVYAIGFAPGFAYLGEVDAIISAPRLSTPRKNVPKGAVAIADKQTAIYPSESPGGWNVIGFCPLSMFDAHKHPAMPVGTGDHVEFYPIDLTEFLSLGGHLPSKEFLLPDFMKREAML